MAYPAGQSADKSRTPFGKCLESIRTFDLIPAGFQADSKRTLGSARTLDPTRPDPTRHRPGEGSGLYDSPNEIGKSPDPNPVQREVWHHLTAGLRILSPNDYGRDWPLPRRDKLAELLAQHDPDLCIRAARETREIVIVQDRAPNITSLFAKRLCELARVRNAVRDSLEVASCQ